MLLDPTFKTASGSLWLQCGKLLESAGNLFQNLLKDSDLINLDPILEIELLL